LDAAGSELVMKFRAEARSIFGPELRRWGFSDAVDSSFGVAFTRGDLEIRVFNEPEPNINMGVVGVIRGAGVLGIISIERLALLNGKDPTQLSLPMYVTSIIEVRPALESWKTAFLELFAPILSGDRSILHQQVPQTLVQRMESRNRIQTLYLDAYGAWIAKDYARLLDLYDELQKLGYELNTIQRDRATAARAALAR